MKLMTLTPAERARVAHYQRLIPSGDFAALQAWLGTFWPFQRPWILDYSRNAFCNKSRQIGISHATAGVLVLWAAFHGETTTVISVGEREAKEVLDKCQKHRKVLCRMGSTMALPPRVDSSTEMHFASGGRIIALPSTGGRSFTGNVYLDEFAYYKDPGAVWDAAMAVTMLGFKARVSSTPNGVGNDFHALVTDDIVSNGWSPHEIPLRVALECGYPVDEKNCWTLAKGDPRLYDQMFNCSFLDGEFQYIPTTLVNASQQEKLTAEVGDYFGGLDIGKTVDRTVIYILRLLPNGTMVPVYTEECRRTDPKALHGMVDRCFKRFDLHRLCVDATGLGSFPAMEMQEKHGFYSVEPIDFTLKSKEALATQLYTAFQNHLLLTPKTDESLPEIPRGPGWPTSYPKDYAKNLRNDICSIRREITTAGNVRYDAPHTDRGHADRAWAIALGVYAASQAAARGDVPEDIASLM